MKSSSSFSKSIPDTVSLPDVPMFPVAVIVPVAVTVVKAPVEGVALPIGISSIPASRVSNLDSWFVSVVRIPSRDVAGTAVPVGTCAPVFGSVVYGMAAYRIRECGWFANERQNKADGADSLPVRGQRHASDGLPRAFRLLLIRDVRLHIQHNPTIMKFTDILTKLDSMVTHGAPPSDIKSYIATVYDHAEALQKEYENSAPVVSDAIVDSKQPPCDPIAWRILQILFDANRHVSVPELCGLVGLSAGNIEHHLNVLDKDCLVNFQPSFMGAMNDSPATAKIIPDGQAFVVKHRKRN
jgi:hypothetical protein